MQQLTTLENSVGQAASVAAKSMLPLESHFSFDFAQFIMA
jgi:hypothetical protein